MNLNDLERREFFAGLAALQIGAALDGATSDGMIYRKLGSTSEPNTLHATIDMSFLPNVPMYFAAR